MFAISLCFDCMVFTLATPPLNPVVSVLLDLFCLCLHLNAQPMCCESLYVFFLSMELVVVLFFVAIHVASPHRFCQ